MSDFLKRLRTERPSDEILQEARERYPDRPEDVIEELARQISVSLPVLRQYHLLHDATPSHSLARALAHEEVDAVMDEVLGLDLSDLGDVGYVQADYACPNCNHEWSGTPHPKYGWGDVAYVPTGDITNNGNLMRRKVGPRPPKWGNMPVEEKNPDGRRHKQKEWSEERDKQRREKFGRD